jgi:hypothetical protein
MALQKRFNDPRKQFVDPYWTIISGVLSHGRGRSKLTLDRRECVELGVPSQRLPEADFGPRGAANPSRRPYNFRVACYPGAIGNLVTFLEMEQK